MKQLTEKNLTFDFNSFLSIKYNETKYYKEKFQSISDNEISAVDFITIENNHGYIIEVKDYQHPETKPAGARSKARTLRGACFRSEHPFAIRHGPPLQRRHRPACR